MKPFNPKSVETKVPQGPGTRGALPFYKTIGNSKRVTRTVDVGYFVPEIGPGRLMADFGERGEWVGVEIKG